MTRTITKYVFDTLTSKPMQGVDAEAFNATTNASAATDVSDSTGLIELTGLDENTAYRIVIKHAGHQVVLDERDNYPASSKVYIDWATGNVTVGLTSSEHILISSTAVQIKDGSSVYVSLSSGALVHGPVANSTSRVEISAGAVNLINRDGVGADTTKISLAADGTATFSGTVTAGAGSIGGFTLSSTALYAGTGSARVQLDTTSGIHLGATAFNDAPFRVSLAGLLVATNVSITGTVVATLGSIGDFTLGNHLYTGAKTAYNDANAGVHVGSDGIGLANNKFTVSAAGALVATSATITGAITATSGSLSGLSVTGTLTLSGSGKMITAASPAARIEIDTTYIAGYSDATTKQFYISAADGKAYAGAGNVRFDADGISLVSGTSSTSSIMWKTSDVGIAQIYVASAGTTNTGLWRVIPDNVGDIQVMHIYAASDDGSKKSGIYGLVHDGTPANDVLYLLVSDVTAATFASSGNLTLVADLAVNGGDFTSTATTFNLLNATVTTLNFGGAATAINMGANGGVVNIAGHITLDGHHTADLFSMSISEGGSYTIALDAVYALTSSNIFSGMLVITEDYNGSTALLLSGGNVVALIGQSVANTFSTTKDTGSRINVYWETDSVKIQNKLVGQRTLYIYTMRTRPA